MQRKGRGQVSHNAYPTSHLFLILRYRIIVVTGGSDGIGREFALQLGKAGFNIFLASRSAEKLNAVAAELGSSSPSIQQSKKHTDRFGF